MNIIEYSLSDPKKCAVQISPKVPTGNLPSEQTLRSYLQGFGKISCLHLVHLQGDPGPPGRPNTAIVVFTSDRVAQNVIQCSRRKKARPFWRTNSIEAQAPQMVEPVIEILSNRRFRPNLNTKSNAATQQSAMSQSKHSNSQDCTRPAKRCRVDIDDITSTGQHEPTTNSSHVSNHASKSPEWMRARIAQLEAELDTTKAARDMATSAKNAIRLAYETEQCAHRESMQQKSSIGEKLARKKVTNQRLRSELKAELARSSTLINDNDNLREQLAAAQEELEATKLYSSESHWRIKALKVSLEEARNGMRERRLDKWPLEVQQDTNMDHTEVNDIKARIANLNAGFARLECDLASTQEQLRSTQVSLNVTQASLDSMEQEYTLIDHKYKRAEERRRKYKEQLRSEQRTIQNLKEILTPEVYQSLGDTQETIGAFLAAVGRLS